MNQLNRNMRLHAVACSLAFIFVVGLSVSPLAAQTNLPGEKPALQTAADDENESVESARQALLQRQAIIQELLPKMEAATVCLEAGGGSGSGVVVNKDGLILTAAHVVAGQEQMKVRFIDGRELTAKVLGIYKPTDAAMAQLIPDGPYEFADVAPEGSLEVGQTVLATGHPSGYDKQRGIPLRIGHIVAFSNGMYASDAPLIGGDSGGPSFNMDGQVIGIHSNISGDMSVNNDAGIDTFLENWDSLLVGETRGAKLLEPENRPEEVHFGAKVINSGKGEPVRVQSVLANTPAAWAGLKAGDFIVAVNNTLPDSATELMKSLLSEKFGRDFHLTVKRGEQEITLDVKLMTRSEIKLEQKRREEESVEEQSDEEKPAPEDDRTNQTSHDRNTRDWFYCRSEIRTGPSRFYVANSKSANQQEEDSPSQSRLQKLVEESQKNNGRLSIDRDELRKLRDELGSRVSKLAPIGGRRRDNWGKRFQKSFANSTLTFSQSIFPLFVNGRQVSLAVMADQRGYFLSKASELEGRKIKIQLNADTKLEAEVIEIERELDIALLKINLDSLSKKPVAIDFTAHANRRSEEPGKGVLCCAVSNHSTIPAGFGVVSVSARALNGNTSAYLGGKTNTVKDGGGARLEDIQPKGPADRAGLKIGDIIESIDSQAVKTSEELEKFIESRLPNEKVNLNIKRGDSWLTLPIQLGDKSKVAAMPGASEQDTDGMSTAMNRRRWNFASGIQHDCAIQPKDCGGVLVDLNGNVIGLNIARAGRIKSYAIPTKLVAGFATRSIATNLSKGVTE